MTDRSSQSSEYVLVRDTKPRKSTRYYYDADDDSQSDVTNRRILQTKPVKEQRIRYVLSDEAESDYRRIRQAESNDRRIKMRHTLDGEQVVLDEDNNVLKIIRNSRSPVPLPTIIENQRSRARPQKPRTLYYENNNGHLIARSSKNHSLTRPKADFVYAEDEPTKVLRQVIVDPHTGERKIVYAKEKSKKPVQQKYIVQKRSTELPIEIENDYEEQQQPQYVQVIERRAVPKPEAPTTKYMMIRKKVDEEPIYATPASPIPASKTVRRIVYDTTTKKSSPSYVYAANGKYYKEV